MATLQAELHRFSFEEFERMADVGILPDERLELLDGLVIEMSPRGDRHAYAILILNELFVDQRAGRYRVNPGSLVLQLGPRDAREPDLVLARATRSYERERARVDDIALLVEVAESSSEYDLGAKLQSYAVVDILEYWVVDIPSETVHVFRSANRFAGTYLHQEHYGRDAKLSPLEFPDVVIPVALIFGAEVTEEESNR
jgi:Uma2 family endonuclease